MKKFKNLIAGALVIVMAAAFTLPATSMETEAASAPKKTKITYLKSTKPGKVTIKYAKVKGVKYQIQVATNSKMTKGRKAVNTGAVSKTLSLKKGVKYWVRVRTYKKIRKKTKYSKWSAKKAVVVKKAATKKPQVQQDNGSGSSCKHKWYPVDKDMPMVNVDVYGCSLCGYAEFSVTSNGAVSFEDITMHPEYIRSDGYKCTGGRSHSESYCKAFCCFCGGQVEYRNCQWFWDDGPSGSNICTRNQASKSYVKITCEPFLSSVGGAEGEDSETTGYSFTGYYKTCACGKNTIVISANNRNMCVVETDKYKCFWCGKIK